MVRVWLCVIAVKGIVSGKACPAIGKPGCEGCCTCLEVKFIVILNRLQACSCLLIPALHQL